MKVFIITSKKKQTLFCFFGLDQHQTISRITPRIYFCSVYKTKIKRRPTVKMPNPYDFLSAFNLTQNDAYTPYRIHKVTTTHNVVEKYKIYTYNIKLTFVAKQASIDSPDALLTQLKDKKPKIIYSQYGNPYMCSISSWKITMKSKDKTLIVIQAEGRAERIYQ
jgi:hypothetical protein